MSDLKLETIHRFIERLKKAPDVALWLASAGAIITGKPIDPTEYYRTIFNNPKLESGPEQENLLALKDVKIQYGQTINNFNVALVDLSLIVAWGAYDPAKSYSVSSPERTY